MKKGRNSFRWLEGLALGANMSTGALFHDEMSRTTSIGESNWVIAMAIKTAIQVGTYYIFVLFAAPLVDTWVIRSE